MHAGLEGEFQDSFDLRFRFVVADNGSEDGIVSVLESMSRRDPAVLVLLNQMNYEA